MKSGIFKDEDLCWMELGEPSIEAGEAGVEEEVTKLATGGWWVYGSTVFEEQAVLSVVRGMRSRAGL
jgi:hypothetical protein